MACLICGVEPYDDGTMRVECACRAQAWDRLVEVTAWAQQCSRESPRDSVLAQDMFTDGYLHAGSDVLRMCRGETRP